MPETAADKPASTAAKSALRSEPGDACVSFHRAGRGVNVEVERRFKLDHARHILAGRHDEPQAHQILLDRQYRTLGVAVQQQALLSPR